MLLWMTGFYSFLSLNNVPLCICATFSLFFHSWTLGLTSYLGYCERHCNKHGNVDISLMYQFPFFWIYTQQYYRISGSYGSCVFSFLGNLHAIFHSTVHYHQQCITSTFSASLPAFMFCLFGDSYSNWDKMISHCGFNLRFPDDHWHWACFIYLLATLYVLFWEMSIQIFWPFSNQIIYSIELFKIFTYFGC